MADALSNAGNGSSSSSEILRYMTVRSSTKDSLLISWEVANELTGYVHGYRVRYQAIGSAITQDSPVISSHRNSFDITQLHENTLYAVCLLVLTNLTSPASAAAAAAAAAATAKATATATTTASASSCLRAATTTHSLSVALGSTFGAFLALGVVVLFVLLAKWQHFRRNRKLLFRQQRLTSADDSAESIDDLCIVQENGEIELNCLEVRASEPDDGGGGTQSRKDGTSPTSEFSADVVLHGASVCSVDPALGSAGPDGTRGGGQRVLIGLDGYSCANSFILTSPSRDSRTGVSYSLLVPLPVSGVLPFMVQQDQAQGHGGHGRDEASSNPTPSERPAAAKVKYQHPVVRLKLRKHPTVDYSSADETSHQRSHLSAQQPEAARDLEQSRDRTSTAFTTSTELNRSQADEDRGRTGKTVKEIPADPNSLLKSTAVCDTLPRSNSNTW